MAVEAGVESSIWKGGISKFVKSPEQFTVHNHLIDTKIYATLGENEFLHAKPSIIHFEGYQVGKTYSQKLRIINASEGGQRMHIIPPVNNVFKINYIKNESLVPGMFLEVTVEFTPKENSYYQDSIRIHSQAASNLIIPLHAYHQLNVASSFPSKINFKSTIIGQSSQKKFQIKNPTPMDFDFQISFIEKHPSYRVEPMSGVIPADSFLNVTITYAPSEYCTACAKLQVLISQFNSRPHFCSLMGSSEPGLAARMKKKDLEDIPESEIDPRSLSPLGRIRAKKKFNEIRTSVTIPVEEQKGVIKDGIHFPKDLNNPAAVSYVLTQKAGKMKAKDVRQAMQQQENDVRHASTKQMKEAVFEHLVGKNISEEQKNQLRWCVRVGETDIADVTKTKVFQDRNTADTEFKVFRRDGELSSECNRSSTNILTNQRIFRPVNQHAGAEPTFDLYLNDEWEKRHRVLTRFIQATRKVIVRRRAATNLRYINKHVSSWRKGFFMSSTSEKPKNEIDDELEIVTNLRTDFDESNIKSFALPEYKEIDKKDDMAVDALGTFDVAAPNVKLKERVEIYKLKVSKQYKILSYNQHVLTSSVSKYIPNKFARELRKGAESEITQTEYQLSDTTPLATPASFTQQQQQQQQQQGLSSASVTLAVPSEFLEPKKFHPMHIFNPLPGVQVHAQPLLYSEIDDDNKLCPLVHRIGSSSNGQDIVPGVMTWKRFPSQSLMSMNNPTISNVYVPRWSDPFEDEINITPTLLTSLPADDVMDIDESESDVRIVPTMEMIQNEFQTHNITSVTDESCEASISLRENHQLPSTNNPQSKKGYVQRDVMQESLDVYLRSRQNSLGERVKSRVDAIQSEWNIV